MNNLIIFLLFSLFASCASDEDEAVDYVREANMHLSRGECTAAQTKLAKASSISTDPFYLKTLSASYACPGDFNEPNFIANDISSLSGSNFLNSLATFSTSNETEAESSNFNYLLQAMEIIIESTSGGNLTEDREDVFGTIETSELNMQLLLMMLAHTGKWLQFYGNSNAAGTKGAGSGSNICFFDYTNGTATAAIDASTTGSCANPYTGHPALNIAGTSLEIVSRRACHFIVNINHILDIVLNTNFSSSDSLGELGSVATDIQDLINTATTAEPNIGPLFNFYLYQDCIDYATTATNIDNVELYLAFFVETNFL